MSPLDLFKFIVMSGLGLACVYALGLGCWVGYLALKGKLLEEPKE